MSIGRSFAFVIALLVALSFSWSGIAVTSAQEASPSPTGTCEAPALPPGTPSPELASPEAEEAPPEMIASPVEEATPEVVGTPADEATAAEATAAAQNIANCIASGDFESALALMTTDFLLQQFGTGNPYDVIAEGGLEGIAFGNFTADNVMTYDDGSVSVDVTYMQTEFQFVAERWFLVQDEGFWKINSLVPLPPQPEGDTAVLGVVMTEYAFTPNAPSVEAQPVVIFHGVNDGAEPHEMIVAQLPEGVTVEQLLADESLFEQVEFYGFAFFEPGQQGDIALVGLEPGIYTLLCFVPAPDGQPHVAHGMFVDIEVTAPAPVVVPSPSPSP